MVKLVASPTKAGPLATSLAGLAGGGWQDSPNPPQLPRSVPHNACGSVQSVNLSVVFNLE